MSYLLKRTKKSMLKFFRKISSSNQLFITTLDEEEISTNNVEAPCSNISVEEVDNGEQTNVTSCNEEHTLNTNSPINQGSSPKLDHPENFKSTSNPTVQDIEKDKDFESAIQLKDYSFNAEDVWNKNVCLIQSLTSKLFLTADGYEFQRLQQLRSDTGSEVFQFEPSADKFAEDIVFEKVNYKREIRYLRRTPSNCSLENFQPGSNSSTPPQNMQNWFWHQDPVMYPNDPNQVVNGNIVDVQQRELISFQSFPSLHKWDENGNLKDSDVPSMTTNGNWEIFDTNSGAFQERCLLQLEDGKSQQSSTRSSSSTLETWLGEEYDEYDEIDRDDDHSSNKNDFNQNNGCEQIELNCNKLCLTNA